MCGSMRRSRGSRRKKHSKPRWNRKLANSLRKVQKSIPKPDLNLKPGTWNSELRAASYAAEQGIAEEEALEKRTEDKSRELVERLHSFFRMHRDHEPGLARSAGFPACGFGRLSSRPSLVHRTGKSGKPAGWKACLTFRFMERREGLREGVNLL